MTSPLGNQICEVLLNLQGYCATNLTEEEYQGTKEVHIPIKSTKHTMCPKCYKPLPIYDTKIRHIGHALISCRSVVLAVTLRRTQCPVCGINTEHQVFCQLIKPINPAQIIRKKSHKPESMGDCDLFRQTKYCLTRFLLK
jgi:transposase